MKPLLNVITLAFLISACAPEIGSEGWCNDLKEKPKGDWTATEAKDYTKHCLFKKEDK
ncbi:DUF3012 domain-containing protein [Catenovulum sp. SM1970]|uniref:DUF3012 domain-containing protein n=1 Tax=Marinifaba aquimaris TaxID=2741323 RepID=UPI00157201BA|nr:DUF3012 domain-containing protein [Marinifaba aquimaris]NTS76791.1 DUF3012 domain-containing protein [Marinifaba aquimaris]